MTGRVLALLLLMCLWTAAPALLAEEPPQQPPETSPPVARDPALPRPPATEVRDLGDGRYQVGAIEVDKRRSRFTVGASLLRREPPLEFLAITRGGYKAYEGLLALEASAYEFNLACILIGLDPDKGKPPRHHFDPAEAEGDRVDVWIEWEADGKKRRVDAADLIQIDDRTLPSGEWVYTGSTFTTDGRFLADIDGTAIGFVHDPASIIEHRSGSLGSFGELDANRKLLPAEGTELTLTVERPRS